MNISEFDWQHEIDIWEKWWNKELGRPLFQIGLPFCKEKKCRKKLFRFLPQYDFSIPAIDIIRDIELSMQDNDYNDASYPGKWMDFGAGVLASMIGGVGECSEETVWFHPGTFAGMEISDISVSLDRTGKWFQRLEEFFIDAAKQFGGKIHIGQTDMGGTLDVLSSLRPGEMLIYDLYDHPEEVKRLTWEIHVAWFEAFEYFNSLLPANNHGYSAWAGLLSQKSHYMLQCDFAYMISPDQFEEFVLPELSASCRRIERPFYHLDGKGQLPHLDHLLLIPELQGIQWIPGDGMPNCSHWPEVYQKIVAADRLVQVFADSVETIEKVLTQTDRPELMLFTGGIQPGEEERLNRIFCNYGIDPVWR